MIKNTTPYIGKIRLKFEKYPEYIGNDKLNKVHLDLGFTKLVSRITPQRTKNEWLINPECKHLIEKYTGGIIGKHTFGENNELTLSNSFLSKDGTYIGDIETGWWYYLNNMTVYDDNPRGVAMVIEYNDTYPDEQFIVGYHGYSHRGGQTFKIGDRLFYASYKPVEDNYEEWEWAGWKLKFEELYSKSDDLQKKWMDEEGIGYVIPFNKKGGKIIETYKECLQAAINMSKYLS